MYYIKIDAFYFELKIKVMNRVGTVSCAWTFSGDCVFW